MQKKKFPLALIALGANLPFEGDAPDVTLRRAIKALSEEGLSIRAVSRFYATPCFPPGAGPDYVNAALTVDCGQVIDLASILARLHLIEARFGRKRLQRWGMRTLDIDFLALGDSILPDAATQNAWRKLAPETQSQQAPEQLILPHPRLQDRAFVLVPLAEIAADWMHPCTGRTVHEMLDDLPQADRDAVKAL